MSKIIRQVYFQVDDNLNLFKNNYWGLADYIRGTMSLWQLCKKYGYELRVNFNKHPISNFINCHDDLTDLDLKKVKFFVHKEDGNLINFLEICDNNQSIFTNGWPENYDENISDDCKNFIIENCLDFKSEILDRFDKFWRTLDSNNKEYHVIHIRSGDEILIKDQPLKSDFINKIDKLYSQILYDRNIKSSDIVLLSDSHKLSKLLNSIHDCRISESKPVHIGIVGTKLDDIGDTIFDFLILTRSKTINQISVYHWSSGFSLICNILYKIPKFVYNI